MTSVNSARHAVECSIAYTGFNMSGLDRSRVDDWINLVLSGDLTRRISQKTPQLDSIEQIGYQMSDAFYDLTLWVFHSEENDLDFIQKSLNGLMVMGEAIKSLIDATPLNDEEEDSYGASPDSYGVWAVEEGYGVAEVSGIDDNKDNVEGN